MTYFFERTNKTPNTWNMVEKASAKNWSDTLFKSKEENFRVQTPPSSKGKSSPNDLIFLTNKFEVFLENSSISLLHFTPEEQKQFWSHSSWGVIKSSDKKKGWQDKITTHLFLNENPTIVLDNLLSLKNNIKNKNYKNLYQYSTLEKFLSYHLKETSNHSWNKAFFEYAGEKQNLPQAMVLFELFKNIQKTPDYMHWDFVDKFLKKLEVNIEKNILNNKLVTNSTKAKIL